jgi:hypothetical protein
MELKRMQAALVPGIWDRSDGSSGWFYAESTVIEMEMEMEMVVAIFLP